MKPEEPDMSAAAIDRRLRIASDLRDLCLSLGRAKIIEPKSVDFEPTEPGDNVSSPREKTP